MKKYRSILAALLVLAVPVILFAGCSESGASGTAFSQTLDPEEGVRIWFECQNKIEQSEEETDYIIEDIGDPEAEAKEFGRETRVIWIKVYKDGKLSTYSCLENVNLGHFSKMTDEEILRELETDEDVYLCGQKDQPYEVYLYSDAAGQEVVFEGIPSLIKQDMDEDPMYFMALISKDQVPTFQVYDSYYGGFVLYNYDESLLREACIVTRCEPNAAFSLDGMDLEGSVLDYKTPEEMLHEKNAELKSSLEENKKADSKQAKE